MPRNLQPTHLALLILAGWINHEQRKVIEYLRTEYQVLKEKLGKKRIHLNDDQRRRLAVKGKILGRKQLEKVGTLFTPNTILGWHRTLVAMKWDTNDRRKPGRPRIRQVIVDLILRFARENPTWGYDRIQGALANVGYHISDTTVGNVLRQHGIVPSPDRKHQTTWATFLKARWDVLAAIDFTTVEVCTRSGLVTFYLLCVMELKTRRVHFAGCTVIPNENWTKQVARELTNCEDGSLQRECLDQMIFFGEGSLRRATRSYIEHYHGKHNHQGLDNQLIDADETHGMIAVKIDCRERLGGMLKYYHRSAA